MRINKFLEESPLFNLAVTYNEVIGDFQTRLSKEGVHFLESLILTALFFEEKAVRPTELARTFQATKSNMSHSLRSLERKGLIERKTDNNDARAYYFSLTKEGKKISTRLIKVFDSTENRLEAAFGQRKINPHLKLFRKLYHELWSSELAL
jgi:DNA-binding MarR family transcriptional regulator